MNDACETAAIHAVFGEHAKQLTVVSTKSMTGHLLGGAGGIEAVFTHWPCETSLPRPPSTTSSLTRNAIWTMCQCRPCTGYDLRTEQQFGLWRAQRLHRPAQMGGLNHGRTAHRAGERKRSE